MRPLDARSPVPALITLTTDFGEGSMTESGYPRIVKLWKRGTPLEEATTVFEGREQDVYIGAYRTWDGDTYYDIVFQATSFYTRNYFLFRNDTLVALDVPEDAELRGITDGQLLVELKSDWAHGERRYAQGALIAAAVDDFLDGEPVFETLFAPGPRSAIAQVVSTRNTVLVNTLDKVVSQVLRFHHDGSGWHREELKVPSMGAINIVSTEDSSDRFYYNYTGFLTPSSLYEADALTNRHEQIKSQPAFFNARGMKVEQFEAASSDGTKIPYFVVKPRGFRANGKNPTLLYGYGGFEISLTPNYLSTAGHAWLERGGVYVLANIRGGGEFGPRWHQAGLKENRQLVFDDFITVAEDLVKRRITSPEHLGIQGGSNGGLLVGATFVQRPDLFNAVVCQVPLLDMKRFHKLLAGASWMAEYGDPDDPKQWEYIGRYSPYQNVNGDTEYPKVFFTTSTRDDRVHPAHARKMVARMLEQEHDVLYYENIEGGHGGAANLKQAAFVNALVYAYLHDRLSPDSRGKRR
jgi:prolyl oligopeptidase